jgi:hypothetical protein
MAAEDVWHIVEARRDDGASTMFRIRDLAPRPELSRIFAVEMPYPITELSRLPNALAYRKLAQFEEQWVAPACTALGWEQVALKIEDGSFFLYMYGAGDPEELMHKLAPYDAALGFFNDSDPDWAEYGILHELLDHARRIPTKRRPPKKAKPKPVAKRKKSARARAR